MNAKLVFLSSFEKNDHFVCAEMSRGPPQNCRFGWQCHRADCYYAHPEGRAIDGNARVYDPRIVVPGMFFPPMARNGHMMHMMAGPMPMQSGVPHQGYQGGSPAQSPTSHPHQRHSGKAPPPCRFGRKCTRRDCYFSHPNGREIEERGSNGNEEKDDGDEFRELEIQRALEEEEDIRNQGAVDEDSWFPICSDCECCKGFIYRCSCPDAFCSRCSAAAAIAAHEEETAADSETQGNSNEDWAPWKDEWFADSKDCSTCHGYRYRVAGQPVCTACHQ